jgi:hypothetical protein
MKSQSKFDWLFAFPEVLKVHFQKRMGMQKGRSRSGLSFSLLSPPFTSIRNEMKDIRVPATKKKSAVTKVTALFLFPSLSNPNSHCYISAFLLE